MSSYHFWVGNKSGYVWSTIRNYKLMPKQGERFKYMGFTSDVGWPKKMSTGRLLHKPNPKDKRKKHKNRKVITKKLSESPNN